MEDQARAQGDGLEGAGHAAYAAGRYPAAAAAWADAVAAARAPGREDELRRLLPLLGHARLGAGDRDGAGACYIEALALARGSGDLLGTAAAHEGLGYLRLQRGEPAAAALSFGRAAQASDGAGDAAGTTRARLAGAGAAYAAGDLVAAEAGYASVLADLHQGASALELAGLLTNLGGLRYGLGQPREAAATLEEAAVLLPAEAVGTPLDARIRYNLGLARLSLGELAVAERALEDAAALYRGGGDAAGLAHSLASLSNLRRYRGDLDRAIAHHREVMALEDAGGFTVQETGGLLYANLEDHALHVDVAREGAARAASGGRQVPEADLAARPGQLLRDARGQRPFVLFAPPCVGTWGPLFPRGATALASYLNHHGVPTVVVPLSHYVDLYLGDQRARERTREVVRDAIASLAPRAIGISVTFSFLYPKGLEIARFAREAAPDIPIVIGGPHVTYQDRICLEEAPEIDVVVRGEGEWTALDLLRALEAGASLEAVAGITWRDPEGQIHRNRNRPLGDVLELPEVDFGLLPADFARAMEVSGVTSRGCTFRCRYCHEFRFWGGVVRQYPAARVVGEMERVARQLGNRMAGIDDSMLSMDDAYFLDLCRQLGASPELPDRFGFLTRVDTITPEGLRAMRQARLGSLSVGLESGSEAVLAAMNKGVTVAQAEAGLRLTRDAGVGLAGFFIVGHPGDNPEESARTRGWVDGLFAEGLVAHIDAAMFSPYPGTPFFIRPDKHGVEILTLDWTRWRRTNRPICQLTDYPASGIYLAYLELLEVMARHKRPARAA